MNAFQINDNSNQAYWKEVVNKENFGKKQQADRTALRTQTGLSFVNKENLDLKTSMRYAVKDKKRPKTSTRNSVFDQQESKRLAHCKSVIGNLKRAKADGLYQTEYIEDHPIHFSNPPYVHIKPGYRAK